MILRTRNLISQVETEVPKYEEDPLIWRSDDGKPSDMAFRFLDTRHREIHTVEFSFEELKQIVNQFYIFTGKGTRV